MDVAVVAGGKVVMVFRKMRASDVVVIWLFTDAYDTNKENAMVMATTFV